MASGSPSLWCTRRTYLKGTEPILCCWYDILISFTTLPQQYGYGSYGAVIEPAFNSNRLSLLDRGFVYAIAHIRYAKYLHLNNKASGGGSMGRPWYEDGKLLTKKNTFNDFIASAKYLLENVITCLSPFDTS